MDKKPLTMLLSVGLALAASILAERQLRAQQFTPYPEFTGARVYVAGVADQYTALQADLQAIAAGSRQSYYLVAVAYAGPGEFATRSYAETLFARWREQAGQQGLPFDPDRSVLLVLAETNHTLAVFAGAELQMAYGLRGQLIDRELVQPHFIPHARAGDYAGGIKALVPEIERWISARDVAMEQERQLAVARAEEISRNAIAAVAAANALLTEGRAELTAKGETGLDLSSFAATFDQIAERLPAIEAAIAADAPAALAQGQEAQRQLQQALAGLKQMATQQAEAQTQLAAIDERIHEVEQAILDLDRQELAFGPVQSELDSAVTLVAAARESVNVNPAESLSQARHAAERLKAALYAAAESPVLKEETDKKSAETGQLAAEVAAALAVAKAAGAGVDDEAAALAEAQRQLAAADEQQKSDYRLAMRTFDESKRKLAGLQREIASARSMHSLLTRQIPLGIATVVLLAIAAVLAWRMKKYLDARQAVGGELAAFKLRVVQFLDRLDLVKQRHQLLPFSDEDYSQPMQGATLALYNDTEAALAKLRKAWLEWMETGNEAARLVDGQRLLGTGNYQQAGKLLATVPPLDSIDADLQKCASELDRLEQAHEHAEPLLAAADAANAQQQTRIEALRAAQLATAGYERDLAVCRALVEEGRLRLTPDPIGARQAFELAAAKQTALAGWIDAIDVQRTAAAAAIANLDAAAQLAVAQRAAGLRLIEDDGNPDPLLARGRKESAAALAALQQADAETAARHVEAAAARALEAAATIERQQAARKQAAGDIPLRRTELQRLRGLVAAAAASRAQLEREHAPPAWSGVAEAVPMATALLDRLEGLLNETEQATAEDRQHYFQAVELLAEVGAGQQQAASLFAAVGQRLKELTELRERGRKQLAQLAVQEREARDFGQRHEQALSRDALSRLAAAAEIHQAAAGGQTAERPDWPTLERQMQQAAAAIKSAFDAATEEVRRRDQLLSQVEAVRRQATHVGQLLAGSAADRPRANQRYRAACQALEAIAAQSTQPHGDWQHLLGQVEEAAADLKHAEQWAQEDIRLAQQAGAAIVEAEKHFQRARTFYSNGVAADARAAEQQLVQARHQYGIQAYEQAVSLADAAERAAREAYDRAAVAVREKQSRREELRRRSVTAASIPSLLDHIGGIGLGGGSGGSFDGGGSGGGHAGSSSPSSPPSSSSGSGASSSSWSGGSGASSSSWSSGASQSKW